MEVYAYCVLCEEKLLDNEKEFNAEYENNDFPICHMCLTKNLNDVQKEIGKN